MYFLDGEVSSLSLRECASTDSEAMLMLEYVKMWYYKPPQARKRLPFGQGYVICLFGVHLCLNEKAPYFLFLAPYLSTSVGGLRLGLVYSTEFSADICSSLSRAMLWHFLLHSFFFL